MSKFDMEAATGRESIEGEFVCRIDHNSPEGQMRETGGARHVNGICPASSYARWYASLPFRFDGLARRSGSGRLFRYE